MSSLDSSASGAAGRRRKPADAADADAAAIEGLAPPQPPRGGRRRSSGARGRSRKPGGRLLPVLLGALALAVVALGVLLFLEFSGDEDGAANRSPSAYTVYPNDSNSGTLASAKVDRRALSADEVFTRGAEKIEGQGLTFTLGAKNMTKKCASAVWGESVVKALGDAGCTQAATGAYTAKGYVGVVAIFNLRDTEASQAVADSLDPPRDPEEAAPGFLVPPTKGGKAVAIGPGYSAAEAHVNGHYLLVTWVQPSGAGAEKKEKSDLTSPLIALGNVDDVLYRRAIEVESMQGGAGDDAPTGNPADSVPGAEVPGQEPGTSPGTGG